MTDISAGAPPSGPDGASLRILAQFIRDLSFENPHAPESLRGAVQPQIELGVELNARGRPDGLFEVDLKLSATAKREAETAFHVELVYSGLFEITGVPEHALEQVLMIEAPRYLFPFARRLISDLTAEGGFPPFLLEPLDFASIYEQRRQQAGGEIMGNA